MRHFETKKAARKYIATFPSWNYGLKVFKKLKGHRNRIKKPFVVGSELEWLNLY